MAFEYVRYYYGVPAELGRRVIVSGKPGIIAADRGHYIGVNFDSHKPGVILNCHPTSEVEYGDMGELRKPSRYAARYQRYLEYGECFSNFLEFCYWDADQERSWNRGY
jgi:hypothetical protein